LQRQWPGGPVTGTFTARYGPDSTYLDSFSLTARDERDVPRMLNEALVRIDQIYASALYRGLLQPDPTLVADQTAFYEALRQLQAAAEKEAAEALPPLDVGPLPGSSPSAAPTAPPAVVSSYVVQFASPDAAAVDAALASVRGAPGVQAAATTSIAIGGTSVMRVNASGSLEELAGALRARGWQVSVGSNALSIRR
jgi:hypothetical protein